MKHNLIQRGVLSGVCFMVTLAGFATCVVMWFVCLILNTLLCLFFDGYDWKNGMRVTNQKFMESLNKFWEQRP